MQLNTSYLSRCLLLLAVTGFTGGAMAKPNILWIITDDHRVDSLNYFNEVTTGEQNSRLRFVMSPNIDKLGRE